MTSNPTPSIVELATTAIVKKANVASFNGKFPVSGKQGLLVIAPQSGNGPYTYTCTTSCEKGSIFKVANTAGTYPYNVAIIPVANFTTADTVKYTCSGGQAWCYLIYQA